MVEIEKPRIDCEDNGDQSYGKYVIEVKEQSRQSVKFKRFVGEDAIIVNVPQWLDKEKNTLKGVVAKLPAREDIDLPIEEHLIVELYSK